jgi:hypothetical protein
VKNGTDFAQPLCSARGGHTWPGRRWRGQGSRHNLSGPPRSICLRVGVGVRVRVRVRGWVAQVVQVAQEAPLPRPGPTNSSGWMQCSSSGLTLRPSLVIVRTSLLRPGKAGDPPHHDPPRASLLGRAHRQLRQPLFRSKSASSRRYRFVTPLAPPTTQARYDRSRQSSASISSPAGNAWRASCCLVIWWPRACRCC